MGQTLLPDGTNSGFQVVATAFLQMFKALVTIVGEPGVDGDHQQRAKRLGLGADFWVSRVKPLYKIRNESDVAHYSLRTNDFSAAHAQFIAASVVFRDALTAYVSLRLEGNETG
jgi:hypothetical protein